MGTIDAVLLPLMEHDAGLLKGAEVDLELRLRVLARRPRQIDLPPPPPRLFEDQYLEQPPFGGAAEEPVA